MKYSASQIIAQNEEFTQQINELLDGRVVLQTVISGIESKNINAIRVKLIRQGFPFSLSISNIDTSQPNFVQFKKTGKVGRPKKEHIGKKVNSHAHIEQLCGSLDHAKQVQKNQNGYWVKIRHKNSNIKRQKSSVVLETTQIVNNHCYAIGQSDNNFTNDYSEWQMIEDRPPFYN